MKDNKIDGSKIIGAADFIISRKRKLYKFAKFNESDNCFQLEEWRAFLKDHSGVFKQKNLTAEIGAGTALFLVEQAKRFPDRIFVAVDVKSDRLYQGARKAREEKLSNIYFVRSRVEEVTQIFLSNSVSEIWLTFSDPYPRSSDARHRLTHERYLKLYQKILSRNGKLYLKTDSNGLFEYSKQSFQGSGWQILEETGDLHGDNNLPEDCKVMTSYEQRFVIEGRKIYFLVAKP